jgi:Zn-dependent protease
MQAIFMIIILVMSVVIHEVSHGYAAYILGDPTAKLAGRLTLNPLKHLDWLGSIIVPGLLALMGGFIIGWAKPVPYNPNNLRLSRGGALREWGPAYVAVAGPAANILLVIIFSLVLRFGLAGNFLNPPAAGLLGLIVLINLALAIFNLLPVPPLDGSKILVSFLPYSARQAEEFFYRYQFILFIILLFIILNTSFLDRLIYFLFGLLTGQ